MVLVAISFLCLLRVYAAGADERKLLYRRQFAPQQAGSASVIGQSASGPEGQGAKPLPGMKIHKESKMPTTLLSKPKVNEIDSGRIVESCAKTMKSNVYEKPKYKFVTVTTKSETIRY